MRWKREEVLDVRLKYEQPIASVVLLSEEDILTVSLGDNDFPMPMD